MVTQSAPAAEDDGTVLDARGVVGHVLPVEVVEPPEGVEAFDFGLGALLPIHPPEVNAHVFEGAVEYVEVGAHVGLAGAIEVDAVIRSLGADGA